MKRCSKCGSFMSVENTNLKNCVYQYECFRCGNIEPVTKQMEIAFCDTREKEKNNENV